MEQLHHIQQGLQPTKHKRVKQRSKSDPGMKPRGPLKNSFNKSLYIEMMCMNFIIL